MGWFENPWAKYVYQLNNDNDTLLYAGLAAWAKSGAIATGIPQPISKIDMSNWLKYVLKSGETSDFIYLKLLENIDGL
jgi:hypothetical protein